MLSLSPICSCNKHASTCHCCLPSFMQPLLKALVKIPRSQSKAVVPTSTAFALVPSDSWFSWGGEFSMSLLLRFTFDTVLDFCLIICLTTVLTPQLCIWPCLVLRKRRIKIWSTGITDVRSNTCDPSSPSCRHYSPPLPEARTPTSSLQFCLLFFYPDPFTYLQCFLMPRLEQLACSLVPSSLWGSRTGSCCPSEKPLAASGDGCKLNKD